MTRSCSCRRKPPAWMLAVRGRRSCTCEASDIISGRADAGAANGCPGRSRRARKPAESGPCSARCRRHHFRTEHIRTQPGPMPTLFSGGPSRLSPQSGSMTPKDGANGFAYICHYIFSERRQFFLGTYCISPKPGCEAIYHSSHEWNLHIGCCAVPSFGRHRNACHPGILGRITPRHAQGRVPPFSNNRSWPLARKDKRNRFSVTTGLVSRKREIVYNARHVTEQAPIAKTVCAKLMCSRSWKNRCSLSWRHIIANGYFHAIIPQ